MQDDFKYNPRSNSFSIGILRGEDKFRKENSLEKDE